MTEALTVGFVDLAGFTSLTEAHGDEEAVSLVDRFANLTERALADDGRLVKTIGDAVMLAWDVPSVALDALERLFVAIEGEADFPLPRAGLHEGPLIERGMTCSVRR